jgi:hypothetical protein
MGRAPGSGAGPHARTTQVGGRPLACHSIGMEAAGCPAATTAPITMHCAAPWCMCVGKRGADDATGVMEGGEGLHMWVHGRRLGTAAPATLPAGICVNAAGMGQWWWERGDAAQLAMRVVQTSCIARRARSHGCPSARVLVVRAAAEAVHSVHHFAHCAWERLRAAALEHFPVLDACV